MSDDRGGGRGRALGRALGELATRQGLPRRVRAVGRGVSAFNRSLADSNAARTARGTATQTTASSSPAVRPAPGPTTRSTRGPLPHDLAAIAVLLLCALVLHRDGLFGGPAFYELDTRLFYLPVAQWVGQQLHGGVFPLWLPAIFTGYPIFADGELGLAYLPQLVLLALLPTPLALVWLRVLHAFLAGLFTYLYLRTLRLHPAPSLGGALVFAFGSFLSAQMHHENIVRSAVWLPAVLTCAERAFRGRYRNGWLALGAVAFAQAALGVHVQPVLMLALAVGLYGVYGVLLTRERAWRPLVWVGVIVAGGMALAAVQWLPLGEWALVSSRRGGVDYEFASAFEIAPPSLVTVLFPFFFRLPDATTWWSLWQQWEIELYVGIPTLSLIVVGVVFSRRMELLYLLPLAVISLLIAMAQYSPVVNLHELLWSIPGFSYLRAPGRFTYLLVFACACLAALGIQALAQRRLRLLVALVGGAPSVALLAALLALLPTWRSWLLADPRRALALVDSTYLSTRAQYPIDPQVVLAGVLSSLDIANPKTAWSMLLIVLTALAFVACLALGHARRFIGQSIFVGLIAFDLLTFASDFHPRAPLAALATVPPAGVPAGARVLLLDASDAPAIEPNQLVIDDIATVQGYSSLPSQRLVEVEAATSVQPALFDLWSAPLIVMPVEPPDLRMVNDVRLRLQHPLLSSFGDAAPVAFNVPSDVGAVSGIRLVGTLSYAFGVAQGQTVANVTVGDQVIPLRAGIELAERAYDRPSLRGLLRHQRAAVGLDFEETTPEGEVYTAHLYSATLPVRTSSNPALLVVAATDPKVQVEVHGLALLQATGPVRSLDLSNRAGFRRLSDDVIENTTALPRAFVLPRAQGFSLARHPELTATGVATNSDVDVHAAVLIEGDPEAPAQPGPPTARAEPASVEDSGPNAVRVTAAVNVPSYLVLDDFYQRGWSARVDGHSTSIFIANALFRAVALEPGDHVVEFRYQPVSALIGAAISGVALVVLCATMIVSVLRFRRHQ